jgi:hypothetical protein
MIGCIRIVQQPRGQIAANWKSVPGDSSWSEIHHAFRASHSARIAGQTSKVTSHDRALRITQPTGVGLPLAGRPKSIETKLRFWPVGKRRPYTSWSCSPRWQVNVPQLTSSDEQQSLDKPSEPLTANPEAPCSECGALGAYEFEGAKLCVNCYAQKGSCCPEFGKDDLWRQRELPR